MMTATLLYVHYTGVLFVYLQLSWTKDKEVRRQKGARHQELESHPGGQWKTHKMPVIQILIMTTR